jgi:hypothetical protein
MGATFQCLGELTSAREHLEQSLVLYDPPQHNPYVTDAATGSKVATLSWLTGVLPAKLLDTSPVMRCPS